MFDHTIVAIATALGEAGIGIVRLSGKESIRIANQVFQPRKGSSLKRTLTYRARYGHIIDQQGRIIDEAIVLVMRGPHSFTGEDVVELQSHGGVVVLQKILELVMAHGAKLAEAGEFTKRAFLNGRIDLTQAEAVIDIIRAKTDTGLDLAVQQLEGSLRQRIQGIREQLFDIVVRIEAAIDFPEDDIPEVESQEMGEILAKTIADIRQLIATASDGKVLREGLKTVISGKPNVGKSSLLNRLLNENRALVTDIPGTTRDVIEEVLNLAGMPFRLLDTAGIRESDDVVEQLGVKKALSVIEQADLVLHVLDSSQPLTAEDFQLLEKTGKSARVIIINKVDLPMRWTGKDLPIRDQSPIVEISLTTQSLDPLIATIIGLVKGGFLQPQLEGAIVTRSRHKQALVEAEKDLVQAYETWQASFPIDLIAVGLQGALEQLGEITGEVVRENIVDRIFAKFCIGK